MYAEITKVKKLTIAQYNNHVQLYFDAVTFLMLHIDQKDPTAYTKDAFICNIFLQLKTSREGLCQGGICVLSVS
jgi:hypothetical protein